MTYQIEQKITAFANQYRVFTVGSSGDRQMVAFAHQKRLAMREKVEFFNDEARQNLVFSVRAEKVMDIHGRFIVEDATGQQIGVFQKAFKASLLRSTYEILAGESVAVTVQERSQGIAILRRVWHFIPILADLPFPIRYHFDFTVSGVVAGTYNKTTLVRDHYQLETQPALDSATNWQTLTGLCVLLDALQSR